MVVLKLITQHFKTGTQVGGAMVTAVETGLLFFYVEDGTRRQDVRENVRFVSRKKVVSVAKIEFFS